MICPYCVCLLKNFNSLKRFLFCVVQEILLDSIFCFIQVGVLVFVLHGGYSVLFFCLIGTYTVIHVMLLSCKCLVELGLVTSNAEHGLSCGNTI